MDDHNTAVGRDQVNNPLNNPFGSSLGSLYIEDYYPCVALSGSMCVEDENFKRIFQVHKNGSVEVTGELSADTIKCNKIITPKDIGKRLSSEIIVRDCELSLEKDISFCMNREPISVILPKGEDGQVKYINCVNGDKITVQLAGDIIDTVSDKDLILKKTNQNVTLVYNEIIGTWMILNF